MYLLAFLPPLAAFIVASIYIAIKAQGRIA